MATPFAFLSDPARVRTAIYQGFIQAYGQRGAALFPTGATEVPQVLIDACRWITTHTPTISSGDVSVQSLPPLPAGVAARVRAWALDLRRVGFPADEYPQVAAMIADVADADAGARAALTAAAETMREAAHAADLAGIPAAAAAQVEEVSPVAGTSGITIARLESGSSVSYAPGQVVPAMHVGRQGVWRGVVPALPANSLGQLEIHVPPADQGGFDLAVGDYLTLGAARGPSPAFEGGRALIVTAGTGVAAAKALLFALLERPARPETCVMLTAGAPEEFYDLDVFAALAATQDWLQVVLVAAGDGAWAQVAQVAQTNIGCVGEDPTAVLVEPDTWRGRDIALCAPLEVAQGWHAALEEAGADPADITIVANDAGPDWTTGPDNTAG